MRHFLVLVLIFMIKSKASGDATENCVVENPFRRINKIEKCSDYDYCITLDDNRSQAKFSTKTAYQIRKPHDNRNDFEIENCSPSKIWLLIRHGTRLPTKKGIKRFREMEKFRDEIVEIANNLKKLPLCEEDWKWFKSWKWNHSISESQANYLVPQGYKELRAIAHNFKVYFPKLFANSYDKKRFRFRHTDTERTRSSFIAFFDQLFGNQAHQQINAVSPMNQPDHLLKAYALCKLWTDQKKQLKNSNAEITKFEFSKRFIQIVADIDSRLGFNGTMEPKRVKEIFNLCRYEQAWEPNKASIWCSLLTSSQIHALEYREDLTYFYKSSHGSKLNSNIKCEAMKDMLSRIGDDSGPMTTVYFSHSAALQLFLTALGALRDHTNLTAHNFSEMSLRKWKTSEISPFAGNIAVVRYKCAQRDQVKFFLNEKLLHFNWCRSDGACDWQNVQSKYAFYANENCDHVYCRK